MPNIERIRLADLSPVERPRAVAGAVAHCGLSVAVIGGLYAVIPFHGYTADASAVVRLVAGSLLFAAVMNGQIRRIFRSRVPELAAAQSLVIAVALFLCLYAGTYLSLSRFRPDSFSAPLDRVDSFYFTVTAFGTVGFGDIVPKSHLARLVVSSQILLDLLLVAAMLRLLFGASTAALRQRPATEEPSQA